MPCGTEYVTIGLSIRFTLFSKSIPSSKELKYCWSFCWGFREMHDIMHHRRNLPRWYGSWLRIKLRIQPKNIDPSEHHCLISYYNNLFKENFDILWRFPEPAVIALFLCCFSCFCIHVVTSYVTWIIKIFSIAVSYYARRVRIRDSARSFVLYLHIMDAYANVQFRFNPFFWCHLDILNLVRAISSVFLLLDLYCAFFLSVTILANLHHRDNSRAVFISHIMSAGKSPLTSYVRFRLSFELHACSFAN